MPTFLTRLRGRLVPLFIIGCASLSLVLLVQPPPTLACSCVTVQPPQESFEGAVAVFSGRVTHVQRFAIVRAGGNNRFVIDPDPEYLRSSQFDELLEHGVAVGFEVARVWKGVSAEEVTVISGTGSGRPGGGQTEVLVRDPELNDVVHPGLRED